MLTTAFIPLVISPPIKFKILFKNVELSTSPFIASFKTSSMFIFSKNSPEYCFAFFIKS